MSSESRPSLELSLPATASAACVPDAGLQTLVLSLFDECGPRLHRYVRSFGLEDAVAEDVVQEVFLSLFRHLQRDRPQHNLRGWLFQVAHNLALRHHRQSRRQPAAGPWDNSRAARVIDPASNPEEQLAEADERRRVRLALQTLGERDRRCLYLRSEGLKYRDIARVLGMSLGGVAKSIARSLGHLSDGNTGSS